MKPYRLIHLATVVVTMVFIAIFWGVLEQGHPSGSRTPGESTAVASGYDGTPAKNIQAPDFTLTDQNGKLVSLHDFRGKVVVLSFLDPLCTDVCPLQAEELIESYRRLGAAARNVVFLAVNVNEEHARVQDVQAFTVEHQLNQIPSWHFLTGNKSAIAPVLDQYGIATDISPTGEVEHTAAFYFIDPRGRESWLLTLYGNTTVPQYVNLIVKHTLALLPGGNASMTKG
jgi:cytochrome oxidase Cu insertion factor (SCO1/SenC/PrrC family)